MELTISKLYGELDLNWQNNFDHILTFSLTDILTFVLYDEVRKENEQNELYFTNQSFDKEV